MQRRHPSNLEEGDVIFYNSRPRELEEKPVKDMDKGLYRMKLSGEGFVYFGEDSDQDSRYDVMEEEPVVMDGSVNRLLTEGASAAGILDGKLDYETEEAGSMEAAVAAE